MGNNQPGVTGHIFNTVGSGVKGGGTPGYACYGATKRGLPQLTDSLVKELDEGVQGYEKKETAGTIQVHSLSPGMVFTKLLLDDSTPELRKFPFGVLAAQPEEVAADLVPKILDQKTNGGSVEFLTTDRILTKFFERFILQKKVRWIQYEWGLSDFVGVSFSLISYLSNLRKFVSLRYSLSTLMMTETSSRHREHNMTRLESDPSIELLDR